jgi:peptide/nickel transport system substrate-binding protein
VAERWRWENANRRLRVTLRPGVTLHDGTPFTSTLAAEILRQSVQRIGNRILYASYSDIAEIRPDGDRDLVFELSRESAFLPEDLDVLLGYGPNNIGTGPYRVVTREPSRVVLERFDSYYLGTPRIPQMIVTPFDTLRTAWTSLLRGDLDMVTDVPPDAVEFIGNEDVQVLSFARRYQYLIAFNSRTGPLRSPAVRRALNLAIDRDALIKTVLQNRGAPSSGPFWPSYWAYDRSVEPYDFDPTQAASLLDEAGFTPGRAAGVSDVANARLRFTCLIPAGFAIWERVALEVQKNLYNIGVDMQFEVVPFQEFDTRMREARFDAALNNIISGPTPARAYIFWQSARRYKGLNVFGYENPEAERLFEVLRTTINEGAVRSATSRLQSVLLEDPPALFLAWDQRARAVRREYNVPEDAGQDPMLTMWQWTPTSVRQTDSTP